MYGGTRLTSLVHEEVNPLNLMSYSGRVILENLHRIFFSILGTYLTLNFKVGLCKYFIVPILAKYT